MLKMIFSTLLCSAILLYKAGSDNSDSVSSGTTIPITGVYHTKKVNRIGQTWARFSKNAVYLQGIDLQLNEDSTYSFGQCETETGTWKHIGDSIYLYCQKKGYSPSLGRELRCGSIPLVFSRQSNGSLYHEEYASSSIPGFKDYALLITRMKKSTQ